MSQPLTLAPGYFCRTRDGSTAVILSTNSGSFTFPIEATLYRNPDTYPQATIQFETYTTSGFVWQNSESPRDIVEVLDDLSRAKSDDWVEPIAIELGQTYETFSGRTVEITGTSVWHGFLVFETDKGDHYYPNGAIVLGTRSPEGLWLMRDGAQSDLRRRVDCTHVATPDAVVQEGAEQAASGIAYAEERERVRRELADLDVGRYPLVLLRDGTNAVLTGRRGAEWEYVYTGQVCWTVYSCLADESWTEDGRYLTGEDEPHGLDIVEVLDWLIDPEDKGLIVQVGRRYRTRGGDVVEVGGAEVNEVALLTVGDKVVKAPVLCFTVVEEGRRKYTLHGSAIVGNMVRRLEQARCDLVEEVFETQVEPESAATEEPPATPHHLTINGQAYEPNGQLVLLRSGYVAVVTDIDPPAQGETTLYPVNGIVYASGGRHWEQCWTLQGREVEGQGSDDDIVLVLDPAVKDRGIPIVPGGLHETRAGAKVRIESGCEMRTVFFRGGQQQRLSIPVFKGSNGLWYTPHGSETLTCSGGAAHRPGDWSHDLVQVLEDEPGLDPVAEILQAAATAQLAQPTHPVPGRVKVITLNRHGSVGVESFDSVAQALPYLIAIRKEGVHFEVTQLHHDNDKIQSTVEGMTQWA